MQRSTGQIPDAGVLVDPPDGDFGTTFSYGNRIYLPFIWSEGGENGLWIAMTACGSIVSPGQFVRRHATSLVIGKWRSVDRCVEANACLSASSQSLGALCSWSGSVPPSKSVGKGIALFDHG